MTSQGDRLDSVSDATAFVAALRELKQRSGLTLRGLEEKAAAQGEVLAGLRETAADGSSDGRVASSAAQDAAPPAPLPASRSVAASS
mgnify:CR=1 FL=1